MAFRAVDVCSLSPRVRGNPCQPQPNPEGERSIPACAGEPPKFWAKYKTGQVYPRVCGGTLSRMSCDECDAGLSPRVRGNLRYRQLQLLWPGSIPACAGEPANRRTSTSPHWVYPRVCGGTQSSDSRRNRAPGLSPRVRGNRGGTANGAIPAGSIPACAGEPPPARIMRASRWVYPRVCGGTPVRAVVGKQERGLSPRVRGNRGQVQRDDALARSIPACAGEPIRHRAPRQVGEVYPRVCGGTPSGYPRTKSRRGLSPRVRGNPSVMRHSRSPRGSIPACAGEPQCAAPGGIDYGVYPRVCGGTGKSVALIVSMKGLSPRVRGNLVRRSESNPPNRSIPACAGEPPMEVLINRVKEVYPRVCGGTLRKCLTLELAHGLSPRVRGNPVALMYAVEPMGSIPACAGEPLGLLITPPAILFARGIMETRWR